MNWLFGLSLPAVFSRRNTRFHGTGCGPEARLAVVEQVVDATEPKIRMLRGYRERLEGAVAQALGYVDEMVSRIPGVLDINRANFMNDARVHAIFSSVDQLEDTFHQSDQLRDFLAEAGNRELKECYALVCMQKTERTIFGMGLDAQGQILRRDVRQTTVSFSDHQILTPGRSEGDARQALRDCMFQSLLTTAGERMQACRARVEALRTELRRLQSRLSAQSCQRRSEVTDLADQGSIETQIAAINAKLEQSGCTTAEAWIGQILEVLTHPESALRLQQVHTRLNRLGIKIEGELGEEGEDIELAEVELGEQSPRVVVLAKFPRLEAVAPPDFVREASRYLNV